MRRLLTIAMLLLFCSLGVQARELRVGAERTDQYLPLLAGKRVALLANHTSMVGEEHLVDLLCRERVNVVAIFSPEHGFRGTADAGEKVSSGVDPKTGIPIRSLYDGSKQRPSDEVMQSFDMLLVDMQDVGLRFYTYYIAMLRMMEACAEFGLHVIVLDRPNPNGMYVDGPTLDMRYKSGVGALPIPVVHGLTMGEIARMAIGEGWARKVELTVVPVEGYERAMRYVLPIAPSPNLRTQNAICRYPAVCLFEGTIVSLGRGTEAPFEMYGHPAMSGCDFTFTPESTAGAKTPPLKGQMCRGVDLRKCSCEEAIREGFTLKYLIDAYRRTGSRGDEFFSPFFEKLVGVDYVRKMVIEGRTDEEIRARWADDVARFCEQRKPYLLYE